MSTRLKYNNSVGRQVALNLVSSASAPAGYSEKFSVQDCEVWNTQFEWADDAADFACTATLWASNKPEPSDGEAVEADNDADWVQMTSAHGFDGLPGGNPAAGDGKDMVDISASGALWYRWKFARTAGSGVLQAYVVKKDRR